LRDGDYPPWAQVVAGSNPAAPTNFFSKLQTSWFRTAGACNPRVTRSSRLDASSDRHLAGSTLLFTREPSAARALGSQSLGGLAEPSTIQTIPARESGCSVAFGRLLVHPSRRLQPEARDVPSPRVSVPGMPRTIGTVHLGLLVEPPWPVVESSRTGHSGASQTAGGAGRAHAAGRRAARSWPGGRAAVPLVTPYQTTSHA